LDKQQYRCGKKREKLTSGDAKATSTTATIRSVLDAEEF